MADSAVESGEEEEELDESGSNISGPGTPSTPRQVSKKDQADDTPRSQRKRQVSTRLSSYELLPLEKKHTKYAFKAQSGRARASSTKLNAKVNAAKVTSEEQTVTPQSNETPKINATTPDTTVARVGRKRVRTGLTVQPTTAATTPSKPIDNELALTGFAPEDLELPSFDSDELQSEDNDGDSLSYFSRQMARSKTSNHTLSRLAEVSDQEIQDALRKLQDPFATSRQRLLEIYQTLFGRWQAELKLGFNLLFYGCGSKRNLLTNFASQHLTDFPSLVVNGYFPNLTIKAVLNSITERILNHRGSFRSVTDQADFIAARFQQTDNGPSGMYLLIHSIDGPALRNPRTQIILSKLAAVPRISMVASSDHINVGTLWDSSVRASFNWIWHDASTFAPFETETSYETSLLGMHGKPTARSVGQVLRSLTPNARGIFTVLAKQQLAQSQTNPTKRKQVEVEANNDDVDEDSGLPSDIIGLTFASLFQLCRDEFLVNNDLTLRTQLTEFRDHQIIQSKRTADGQEYLVIPLDQDTLQLVLNNM